MRAVAPVDALLAEQPQVGLVDQRGRLQRVPGALAAQLRRGDALELGVDPLEQLLAGAGSPARQACSRRSRRRCSPRAEACVKCSAGTAKLQGSSVVRAQSIAAG